MGINSDKDVESKLLHEFHCRMTTKCHAVTVSVKHRLHIIQYFYWPMSSTTYHVVTTFINFFAVYLFDK